MIGTLRARLTRLDPRQAIARLELAERWAVLRRDPRTRFAVRFALLAAFGYAVLFPLTAEPAILGTASLTAWLTGHLTPWSAEVAKGTLVSFQGGAFTYQIVAECTGVTMALLFGAAVLAYPAGWRQRFHGLGAGLPILFTLNLARLGSLAWLGLEARAHFDLIHEVLWQPFLLLVTAGLWLLWVRLVTSGTDGHPRSPWTRRVRGALPTIGTLGVVLLAGILLAALGTAEAYQALLEATVGLLFAGAGPGTQEAAHLAISGAAPWLYGGLVATLALFLAAPKVAVRSRLIGAGAALVWLPLVHTLLLVGDTFTRTHGVGPMGIAVAMAQGGRLVIPFGIWLVWWRTQRSRRAPETRLVACPGCSKHLEVAEVDEHLNSEHRLIHHRLRRTLEREHPGLADHLGQAAR